MKTIDKNIEWIVAIAVMMISTFSVSNRIVYIFLPIAKPVVFLSRPLLVILLLLYQNKWYGIKQQNRLFLIFFFLYSVFILLYITELAVYPLQVLRSVPSSVGDFIYKTILLTGYLLCAKTIYQKFNVSKFIVVSILGGLLPTLWYINLVGINYLQTYGNEDDLIYIGQLRLAYTNAPLLILAILNFSKLFRSTMLSRIISMFIIIAVGYIFIISTKRGPILWSFLCLFFCLYYIKRNILKYILILGVFLLLLYLFMDVLLDWISSIAPYSAERIARTLYEGDLTSRYDETNKSDSAYFIAFNQFFHSPIWGSYFRLIANGYYKGHYPHNIFLEVLITMGMIGFVPFIILLRKAFMNIHNVFRFKFETNQLSCIVLFLMYLLKLLTTGSLLLDDTFWVFFYIVVCFQSFTKSERLKNKLKYLLGIIKPNILPMRKLKGKE